MPPLSSPMPLNPSGQGTAHCLKKSRALCKWRRSAYPPFAAAPPSPLPSPLCFKSLSLPSAPQPLRSRHCALSWGLSPLQVEARYAYPPFAAAPPSQAPSLPSPQVKALRTLLGAEPSASGGAVRLPTLRSGSSFPGALPLLSPLTLSPDLCPQPPLLCPQPLPLCPQTPFPHLNTISSAPQPYRLRHCALSWG